MINNAVYLRCNLFVDVSHLVYFLLLSEICKNIIGSLFNFKRITFGLIFL